MIARVVRVDVNPDRIDDIVGAYREEVRPIHARGRGSEIFEVADELR